MSVNLDDDGFFDDEEFDTVSTDTDDADTGTEPEEEPAPEPEFGSVYQFVEDHLVLLYARQVEHKPSRLWCRRWFEHAEALSRLEGLWRAYESLRLDPATGMSVWWRDHADHHMRALMAADGPFEGCNGKRGHDRPPPPLPVDPMTDDDLRAAMGTDPDHTDPTSAE